MAERPPAKPAQQQGNADDRKSSQSAFSCPVSIDRHERIQLAHGGGGELMHQLIEGVFAAGFADVGLQQHCDAALIDTALLGVGGAIRTSGGRVGRELSGGVRLAMATDSYVVDPLVFPGGDIGTLSVNGTVNDLAMMAARPGVLSVGFILEEGLEMATLERIVTSMRNAARSAGVAVVTGDTKVVDRGKGDGMYINTTGIGLVVRDVVLGPDKVEPGDAVIVSGDLGRHGVAILSVREGFRFDSAVQSDCAPVVEPVMRLLDAGVDIHCMRDLTRGGLTSAVVEIARSAGVEIALEEAAIPVSGEVRAACELLGLDPLYMANEGRFVVLVAESDKDRAVATLRSHQLGGRAQCIGTVHDSRDRGLVVLETAIGSHRILDMLSGQQLPRIC
ncbi:MAG: hydrogenase expression/formation protein HypE [Proteobacteria bacterium]|nr:hydrogenase expression/formation protein HypE [Pseudomonadota bacterium]